MEELIVLATEIGNLANQKKSAIDNFRTIQDKHFEKLDGLSTKLCKKQAELEVIQEQMQAQQDIIMKSVDEGGVKHDDPYPEDLNLDKIKWLTKQ